jgi:exodeoxyribonuclease VII small subunit
VNVGFDQVLDKLKGVVEKLEQGNLTLEESLRAFEEGVALARQGHVILDSAEKRVDVLVQRGGAATEVPLNLAGGDPAGG